MQAAAARETESIARGLTEGRRTGGWGGGGGCDADAFPCGSGRGAVWIVARRMPCGPLWRRTLQWGQGTRLPAALPDQRTGFSHFGQGDVLSAMWVC